MTLPRSLLALALASALSACSGFTHLHSPKTLPPRGGSATMNALVPVDFSVRVGVADGWDAGVRFTGPGLGFSEIHADVQRDLRPGRDGRTVSLGMGVGLSRALHEWVLERDGGTAWSFQPYAAFGDERAYAALRPVIVVSREDGARGWLPILTAGTVRGDRVKLVPEVNLVGLTLPTAGLGVQYRVGELWRP